MGRQSDTLAAVRAELAAALAERQRLMRLWLPADWIHERCLGGLTPKEAWLAALLIHRPQWTREGLYHALFVGEDTDHDDYRMVDVLICKLRRKLRPAGIEILTYYGKGFGMHADMRAKAERLLREQSAAADAEDERRRMTTWRPACARQAVELRP